VYWGGFSRNTAVAVAEGAHRPVPRGMSAGSAPDSTAPHVVKLVVDFVRQAAI